MEGELFGNCVSCQADLVEVVLELQTPPSVGPLGLRPRRPRTKSSRRLVEIGLLVAWAGGLRNTHHCDDRQ